MSDWLDIDLGEHRLRLTAEGDLFLPPASDARLRSFLLEPLSTVCQGGKAEAGYFYDEVQSYPAGTLPALRLLVGEKLPQLGLTGRAEPPLPPPEADQGAGGDLTQDMSFDG